MVKQKGKIVSWNKDKGFGFISPLSGGKQIFIHITAFRNSNINPKINQVVLYDISQDGQGRVYAENASRYGDKPEKKSKNTISITSLMLIGGFFLFLAIAIFTVTLPAYVIAYYFIASILTFLIYAFDKSAAIKDNWRVPENTLHFSALLGGWPGALIAQDKLRHKSKKQPFRMLFWVTLVVNFGTLLWLLTPNGNFILQSFIAN